MAATDIVVTNPANGKELGRVKRAGAAAVDRAVRNAAQVFASWREVPVIERTRRFFKLQVLLEEHLDELTTLVANENGKMYADARGEVRRGIECVEFACGMPSLLMGDSLEGISRGIDSHTVRQPLGVCAGITPFNFPAMIPCWMFPIAIAAGNTFILKPSPQTPLSAERLLQLFNECGFPENVMQIVHGDADVVEALIKHEQTAAVSFVGSSAIARRVQALAVEHHKRVTALGGAKNFLIIMPDGVNDATVDGILGSAFGAAGERCLAGSVVIAVAETADKLVPMLQKSATSMKVASWDTDGAQMGPVISEQARTRIVGYIENGLRT
ncbi:MAG: aldehyde dehydrogenase family protein, partial [Vulcanimicrobiaceae bacterium]